MDIKKIMKEAQEMQKKILENQNKLKETYFVGTAGNGGVKITMDGLYNMKKIEINEDLVEEDSKDILEDLIVIAHKDCKDKISKETRDNLSNIGIDPNLIDETL